MDVFAELLFESKKRGMATTKTNTPKRVMNVYQQMMHDRIMAEWVQRKAQAAQEAAARRAERIAQLIQQGYSASEARLAYFAEGCSCQSISSIIA